ncbi:MAG: lysylphosphatidylglycerol synthase transmembrane domain-containing protein [Candidatus Aminicenantes bacterium]|nr:lysylphosphatidylglycerol synthase transmembrane domain-containing protein [Candidatus Aminicenantes bacterium]
MAGRRKTFWTLLKLGFSVGVLAWVLSRFDLASIARHLRHAAWPWLAVAFALNAVGLLIRAYRWRILALARGDDLPIAFLFRSCLIGEFFNSFLPTNFGGDAYRIWDGSRQSRSLVRSSAIVIVERMSGILILLFFAVIASLLRLDMVRRVPLIAVSLLLGIGGFAVLGLFFLPAVGRRLQRPPAAGPLRKAMIKAAEFRSVIVGYRDHPRDFLRATAWAFLLQLNVILYYFLIGRALGLRVPALDYFVFIPLVLLIQLLPISINGLGVREVAYIEIFKFYGVAGEMALSFSIIGIAFGLLVSVVGGILLATRK